MFLAFAWKSLDKQNSAAHRSRDFAIFMVLIVKGVVYFSYEKVIVGAILG